MTLPGNRNPLQRFFKKTDLRAKGSSLQPKSGLPPLAVEEKRNLKPAFILANFMIASIIYGIVTFLFFGPFHMWETALYVTGISFPGLAAVFLAVQKMATNIHVRGWNAEWAAGYATVGAALFIVGTVFTINIVLDRAPGAERRFVITDKGVNSLTRNTHYLAWFPIPVASPLSFAFSDLQNVDVEWGEYQTIKPGVSRIDVVVHNGALGFPWYGRNYYVSNSP